MKVLGVSGPPRDSAVCLVIDGVVCAAAQEERFSRRPHDGALPIASLACCLETGAIASVSEIDAVVFHETSHATWLRDVLPDFAGRVVIAAESDRAAWTAVAPANAAAAIEAALSITRANADADAAPADAALGPSYTSNEVRELLDRFDLPYEMVDDVPRVIARLAAEGNLVGVVRDRMEFGDVSLGHRSLVALAGDSDAVRRMVALAGGVNPAAITATAEAGTFLNRLDAALKSRVAAGTLAHAPFRTTDEPTVCSPIDAYRCMMRSGIDAVVIADVLIRRGAQPAWPEPRDRS